MDRSGPGGKSSDTSEREPSLFHSLATCRPLCPSGKESPRLHGRLGGLPRRKQRGLGGGQTGSCRIQCPLPQSCCSFLYKSKSREASSSSPLPVPSAPIKSRMESIRWLAPIIVPLPRGRGLRFRPSRTLAGWVPTHPLGLLLPLGGRGTGLAIGPGLAAPNRRGAEFSGQFWGRAVASSGRDVTVQPDARSDLGEKNLNRDLGGCGPSAVWEGARTGRSPATGRAESAGPPPTHSRPRLPARGERGGESWVGRGVR